MSRSSNGRSSIYQGADGQWHGWVTVGIRPDGAADRRHRMAGTRAELTVKVRELERLRDAGQLGALGPAPTVAKWLRVWLDTIAPRTASTTTIETVYRPRIERWIIPRIGGHRLDRVRPEHLDALYLELAASGLSSKSVLMVHQILGRSYRMAMRRGIVGRNITTLVDPPRHREPEMSPLTAAEARRILAAAAEVPNTARWSVALALGLRQSEALGLRWQHVDLDRQQIRSSSSGKSRTSTAATSPRPAPRAGTGTGAGRAAPPTPGTAPSAAAVSGDSTSPRAARPAPSSCRRRWPTSSSGTAPLRRQHGQLGRCGTTSIWSSPSPMAGTSARSRTGGPGRTCSRWRAYAMRDYTTPATPQPPSYWNRASTSGSCRRSWDTPPWR